MNRRAPAGGSLSRAALFIFLAAALLVGCVSEPPVPEPKDYAVYYKAKAISPSHIEITGGMKIRLIGVESPAPSFPGKPGHPYREEAVRLMKDYMKGVDVAVEQGPRERDRFDVPLAFVFARETDPMTGKFIIIFLNALVLEKGWGKFAPTGENNRYDEILFKAQMKAQSEKLGIWKYE